MKVITAAGTRTQEVPPMYAIAQERWKLKQVITYNEEPADYFTALAHLGLFYPDGRIVVVSRGPKGGWVVHGFLTAAERSAVAKIRGPRQLHLGRQVRT